MKRVETIKLLRPVASAALALLISGCSIGRSDVAIKAKTELIGLSKAEILHCAGVPDRSAIEGTAEFLTYDNAQTGQSGITLPIIGGGINLVGDEYCRATFMLIEGKVASLTYAGNTGNILGSMAMCGFAVDTCVKDRRAAFKVGLHPGLAPPPKD